MKHAGVLSVGTELVRGELVNTNAAWLGEQLTRLGYEVLEQTSVSDDADQISAAIRRLAHATKGSDPISIVMVTGGLGPTSDDRTALAAANAAGVGLEHDPETLRRIQRRWVERGTEMPASNRKQAEVPAGAAVFANPVGTAPGFSVQVNGCRFFFLPGVPGEMKRLFEDAVLREIAAGMERTTEQIHLRTFGLPESAIGDLLDGVEEAHPGVELGFRAHFPEIEVKVLARASSAGEAEQLARRAAAEVRRRLGDVVYGEVGDSFPGAVGDILRSRGCTLALAESCTGGMVGAMLTSVPGSSEFLLLDAVVYSNAAKSHILGVQEEVLRGHGAVSLETAEAMADGALRVSGADMAVSVTGIAGPGGGTDSKPVGTVWFGVARRGRPTVSQHRRFAGDRERIRTLASYHALRLIEAAAVDKPIVSTSPSES